MKKKEDKKKDIDALRQDLEQSRNLFVTGYEKLRVDQDFELRKVVRGAGGKYRVIKNNLADKASEGMAANDVRQINDLASMPSKEEIFAKLLYLINAPAQRLATAVNAVGRNLAVVVDQGVKENKFGS